MDANRLLKFAKENSDVGLNYPRMGPFKDLQVITAFDASFCSRVDGSSQGGFLVMLAPKHVLETHEDVYHILDWKSFKLPRVARSSLAAEAQAAAFASDATEFVCRYYEHLLWPDLSLREVLQRKSSLQPVMITDAKALFDSYHRDALVSNVTDRRSSLEIRVVKEQVASLGGTLRWVSSDRQIADGLTKDTMRQNLADKLRHGMVKFLYDPNYVAAKKKSLQERKQELKETSRRRSRKTPKQELNELQERTDETALLEEHEAPLSNIVVDDVTTIPNDLATAEDEVTGYVYLAQFNHVVEYVNARPSHVAAQVDNLNVVKYALTPLHAQVLFWMILVTCFNSASAVETCQVDLSTASTPQRGITGLKMCLLGIFSLGCLGLIWGCHRVRRLQAQLTAVQNNLATVTDHMQDSIDVAFDEAYFHQQRANAMAIVLSGLQLQLDRKNQALERATQAYVEQRNAAQELRSALRLSAGELQMAYQLQRILQVHTESCAMGRELSIQDGSRVWHVDPHCPYLYDAGLEIRGYEPCRECGQQNLIFNEDEDEPM